jgi:mono/diheme cytochrome c family protein
MVGTDLIPAWGKWYSKDSRFHEQAQALQRGSLAVDRNQKAINPEMAWAGGGVQQSGGLGVPLWRLPFDVAAKAVGQRGFPDRLALGIFMALMLSWMLRGLTVPISSNSVEEWLHSLGQHPETIASVFILALAPPFLALCRTSFASVEETAAYAYLASIGLLVASLRFVREPSLSLYCGLGAGSALVGFFSPTALAGGFASLLIALYYTRVAKWPWWKSVSGIGLFCLGGIALFASNYLRFGSGFEFGHSLNLDAINGTMFASRFSHPFASESFASAAKESFSLLFLAGGNLNGSDWYKSAFFPGQSAIFRWRQLNFSTYDLPGLGLMLLAWAFALRPWVTSRRSVSPSKPLESVIMALWSFLSFVPLFFYYLRHPFISSTSLLDFAPAIAVAALSCVWAIGQAQGPVWLPARVIRWVLLAGVVVWWSCEVAAAKVLSGPDMVATSDQLARLLDRKIDPPQPLPNRYAVGFFTNSGIFGNGLGWNPKTAEAASCVAFFVDDPDSLEILVAPREDTPVAPGEFTNIQAKIGLQKLVLASNEAVAGGRRLVFSFPEKSPKPTGLQVAFLGFVAPKELTTANSNFRLLGLSWHKASEEFNVPALLAAAAPEGPKDPYSESRARVLAEAYRATHPPYKPPVITNALPAGLLAFDAEKKEDTVHEGEPQAHFVFNFTNTSSKEVTVCDVKTSCGCTTAELPPMPWNVAPHTRGRIPVTMNVMGRTGTNTKTLTVTTLQGFKTLDVVANVLPPDVDVSMGERERNQQIAKSDRQAVFKGDCAKCHAESAMGKTGQELYVAACAICHEATPRATMVTDLRSMDYPTGYNFWKVMVTAGVPNTLMPAFAAERGGPLTGDQIESLAKTLTEKYPSKVSAVEPAAPAALKP